MLKKFLRAAAVALFWLLVWQAAAACVSKEVLLPSPISTAKTFITLAGDAAFWLSALYSITRIMVGFLLGCMTGAFLSLVCHAVSPIRALLSPLMTVVKSTPVASFIVLALVWIGRGTVPTFISFLMVLPIVFDAVSTGISSADRELIEVADVFEFSRRKRIELIYLPCAARYFISASSTALGLAWKAGIAAEVLATPKMSIGTSLYEAKIYLESPSLFAWTALVIILSLIFEKLFKKASNTFMKKLHLEVRS